jgi:asparaginyl-tRNA synthetase
MSIQNIYEQIQKEDINFIKLDKADYILPIYNPTSHYLDLTSSHYYRGLLILRHYIKMISDYYFSQIIGAKNIDLFMLTPSISSPMGSGSDSEAISIKFGDLNTFLVDSSQFGFEPLIINGLEKVYCYLPSMRGENPDQRHLNQFYHCEAEIAGKLDDVIWLVENYVNHLSNGLIYFEYLFEKLSLDKNKSINSLSKIIETKSFNRITFDDAVIVLEKNGSKDLINYTKNGRDIKSEGEVKLMEILNQTTPLWITNYDRDRVPFYQKPIGNRTVLNADLLFPPLIKNSFAGEIIGCGQRQDNTVEIYESLKRQGLDKQNYEWYINLCRQSNYSITSGFGMGVERFITWLLCRDDIKEAIIYPRLKNTQTLP